MSFSKVRVGHSRLLGFYRQEIGVSRRWTACRVLVCCLAPWLITGSSSAWADPVVTPGAVPSGPGQIQKRLLDEIQREQIKKLEEQKKEDVPAVDDSSLPRYEDSSNRPARGGLTFELTEVVIEPVSSLLAPAEIDQVLSPFLHTQVSIGDVQEIVSRINSLYRDAGHYNARARLPPQKVKGGVVQIQLIEGRLGDLSVNNAVYTNDDYFRSRVGVYEGEVVNLNVLASDMEWFNRTSDVQARARLKPGEDFGETDVILDVIERRPLSISLYADNTGSTSTGEERGGINVTHASLLGYRDQLSVNLSGAEGELSGVASYSVPVNHWNGRLGYSYANTDIDIVNGNLGDLNITGESTTQSLYFDQPFYVGHGFKLAGTLSGGKLKSSTELDGLFLQDLEMKEVVSGLGMEYLGDSHFVYTRLSYSDLASETNERFDSYFWSASLSYLYRINSDWRVAFRSELQYTDDELLPSARVFQIGGFSTVRGYDEGAVSGNKGYFMNLELHYVVKPWLSAFVFTDAGEAVPFRPGESYSAKSEDKISSYGGGMNLNYGGFSLSLAYGKADQGYLGSEDAEHKNGRLHGRIVYQVW